MASDMLGSIRGMACGGVSGAGRVSPKRVPELGRGVSRLRGGREACPGEKLPTRKGFGAVWRTFLAQGVGVLDHLVGEGDTWRVLLSGPAKRGAMQERASGWRPSVRRCAGLRSCTKLREGWHARA